MTLELKLRFINVFFFFLVFLFGIAQPAHAIDGFIKLTSPNGGESLKEGQSYTITWDSSSNIDKVNIGYSSGPGHLNWVVFTTANTGSYTWNVDVGNTTNTQFILDITGYETGKGSVSDKSDGYFTVTQKEEYPPKPSPTSQTTPTSPSKPGTSTTINPDQFGSSSTVTKVTPTPLPSPKPTTLTYKTLKLDDLFFFDGSQTTDLSKVLDPAHVKNFTLDTPEGYVFLFTEDLNLTDPQTLKALAQADEYLDLDMWWMWIKIEWWVTYEITTPIEVTYENSALTSFEPTIINELTQADVTKVSPKKKDYNPETAYKILGAYDDKLRLQITDGAKLKIEPRVELEGENEVETTDADVTFAGRTSHTDVVITAKVNGKDSPLEITPIKGDGSFKAFINDLPEGRNFVQFFYKKSAIDTETKVFAERTVTYQPVWYQKYQTPLVGGLLAAISAVAGFGLSQAWPQLRTRFFTPKENLSESEDLK